MPNVNVVDPNFPAAAVQDNIIGRLKQLGQLGGAGIGNEFGIPPMAAPIVSLSDPSINASGTVQNTLYTLNSVTVPANAFNVTNRTYTAEFWGVTAANANAKDFLINFGTFNVVVVTGSVANGSPYYGGVSIITTAPNTQSLVAWLQIGTAVAPALTTSIVPNQVTTGALVISLQSRNTAAAAASATGQGWVGQFGN